MSDLVGNPEDRFSQNEAQNFHVMPVEVVICGLKLKFHEARVELQRRPLKVEK